MPSSRRTAPPCAWVPPSRRRGSNGDSPCLQRPNLTSLRFFVALPSLPFRYLERLEAARCAPPATLPLLNTPINPPPPCRPRSLWRAPPRATAAAAAAPRARATREGKGRARAPRGASGAAATAARAPRPSDSSRPARGASARTTAAARARRRRGHSIGYGPPPHI